MRARFGCACLLFLLFRRGAGTGASSAWTFFVVATIVAFFVPQDPTRATLLLLLAPERGRGRPPTLAAAVLADLLADLLGVPSRPSTSRPPSSTSGPAPPALPLLLPNKARAERSNLDGNSSFIFIAASNVCPSRRRRRRRRRRRLSSRLTFRIDDAVSSTNFFVPPRRGPCYNQHEYNQQVCRSDLKPFQSSRQIFRGNLFSGQKFCDTQMTSER